MTDLAFRFSSASTVRHSLLSADSCELFERQPVAYQSFALTIRADRAIGGQSKSGPYRGTSVIVAK